MSEILTKQNKFSLSDYNIRKAHDHTNYSEKFLDSMQFFLIL